MTARCCGEALRNSASTRLKRSGRSAIGRWPHSSKISRREFSRSVGVLGGVGGGDDPVLPAPQDERGNVDLAQAVVDVVAGDAGQRLDEPLAAVAAGEELPQELGADLVRPQHRSLERPGSRPRTPEAQRLRARVERRHGVQDPGGHREPARREANARDSNRGDECDLLEPSGLGDRGLSGDETAERAADDRRVANAERRAEVEDEAAVVGNRHRPGRGRGVAESGQVERDHAVRASEMRDLLEPVLPAARQPMYEDEGQRGLRPRWAHLHVVDCGIPPATRPPLEAKPRRPAER